MRTTLILIFLAAFLLTADYTVQNNQIPKVNLAVESKLQKNVIYYDKLEEFKEDGIHKITRDSITYYEKRQRNRN